MNLRFIWVILIIAMLTLSTHVNPSGTKADYGVLLECQSNEHYTEMEQYTYYEIKITNTGDSDDTYILTKDPPPEHWQTQLSEQVISIPAQESRNVTLGVKPTCECELGVKVYINVTATSETDASVFDTIQTITTYARVKVSLDTSTNYAQIDPDESYTYEIIVKNEGSENDSFRLSVSQPPELSTVIDEGYITLPSNGNGTINLTVTAPSFTPYGYYELSIKAESLHNSERSDILTITTIVGEIELKTQNKKLSNKHPKEGDTLKISLEILNNGTVNATNLVITLFYLTNNDLEIEIGSELASLESGKAITIQKAMNVPSNFTGILIKAKIKGEYEIWQESFTYQELGLGEDQPDAIPFYLIVIILLVGIMVVIVFAKLWKRKT